MTEKSDQDGAWVFVSHSHKDLKKVREIRNRLEQEGHKPLLFYLKCLEEADARLPQLIKDEIEARTWFVLCDSESARASNWVAEEMRIVRAMGEKSKFHVTIDLSRDIESQQDKLAILSKRATVFVSYARSDRDTAAYLFRELAKQDYRTSETTFALSADLGALASVIEEAVQHGFVLLLLSPDYLTSQWCAYERSSAFKVLGSKLGKNVIPVIIKDPASVYAGIPSDLMHVQCWDVTEGDVLTNIKGLLADLKTRVMA